MVEVIVPIREVSEEEAITWLKAQDGGRTSLRPFELAQRFGWPQYRLNRRLKKWAKDGLVVRRGDTIKVADAPAEAGAPQAQRKAPLKSTTDAVQFIDNTPEKHVHALLGDAASGGSDLAPPSTAIPARIAPRLSTIDVLAYGSAITLAGAA